MAKLWTEYAKDPLRRWENNIIVYLKGMGHGNVDWIQLPLDGVLQKW